MNSIFSPKLNNGRQQQRLRHGHDEEATQQPNMVVYLPPGPSIITGPSRRLHHDHHHGTTTTTTTPTPTAGASISKFLQESLSDTTWLVTINYRLRAGPAEEDDEKGPKFQFPIPIHDVTTVFEYLNSASPTLPWNSREQQDQEDGPPAPPPKICLLGSHIGGALATMLTLTESDRVHALAALEPMVDWVGLDELVKVQGQEQQHHDSRKRTTHAATAALVAAAAEKLIKLRARLFDSPSAYFDPFASPLLFLRAPGRDTPTSTSTPIPSLTSTNKTILGDSPVNDIMGLDDLQQQQQNGDSTSVSSDAEEAVVAAPPPPRRRKVLRRWPAVGNPDSVLLPHVKVFVHAPPPPPLAAAGSAMTGGKRGHVKHPAAGTGTTDDHHDGNNDHPDLAPDDLQLGLAALKRAQGTELVQFMRRACFVGRDKSLAEERAVLHQLEEQQNPDPDSSPTNHDKDPSLNLDLHKAALQWIEDT
ncbi:hypothetical protein ABEF95_001938 [Exophiala dermatitidis]